MNNNKSIVILRGSVFALLLLLVIAAQSQDFFWRGGTGNWSDPSNWYSTNGGIPTAFDNVVFDASSFTADNQRVTIDRDAVCKNMDWTALDRPVRFAGKNRLTVFGSFRLNQQMVIQYSGDIYFKSKKKQQAINFAGVQLHSNLMFEGKGQWDFKANVDIGNSALSLLEGEIKTKGKAISCGSFSSTGEKSRKINLAASVVKIVGHTGGWEVTNSLVLVRGSSRIIFACPNPLAKMVFDGAGLHYNKLEFSNNLDILGNNTIEQLKLNPGITCRLEGGKTQTIIQKLSARGCSGLIDIQSTNLEHAIIKKTGGNINISFVGLRLIQANMPSDGTFKAHNSVDNGSNIALSIYTNSRDMHWLNGDGYWSDTTHWTSQINSLDSKCVPLPYDNVFFDQNSFSGNDTVRLDLVSAWCNDFFWTSNKNAVLKNVSDSSKIVVYGSLRFSAQMKNLFEGEFSFRDTTGNQFIETNGNAFKGDVDFSGKNGQWDLKSTLKAEGRINFQRGSFNSNNHAIICNSFISDSAFSRSLNLGSSLLKVTMTSPREAAFCLNNDNLLFTQSKLRIELTGEEALFKSFGGDTIHYHQVSFTNPIGLATLRNDSTYSVFQSVSFASNAFIWGNNVYDTIKLSTACVYSLPSGRTQTINNKIIAPVSCEGSLIIRSTRNGSPANLRVTGDSLLLKYVSLRDIRAIPPAVYIAENAVDLGNNIGWEEISGNAARNLYWVGGSGDWNDAQHWSLTSSGAGGECVPTPIDNVYFDKSSFAEPNKKVSVVMNNAFAHNMSWSNEVKSPKFSTSKPTSLRIFGSLTLTENMSFLFNGPIYFESSQPGNTIETKGAKFYNLENDFYFDGVGGEWTLLDGLDLGNIDTLRNSILLINGSLFFNDQTVKCSRFYSPWGSIRTLSLGASQIFVNYYWYLDGRNLEMRENTARIQIERGPLYQRNTTNIQYRDLIFNSEKGTQSLVILTSDTVKFRNISFNNGVITGEQSHVFADKVQFTGKGSLNSSDTAAMNIYNIGHLSFGADGTINGNDTVGELLFSSAGIINGNGVYGNTSFADDGQISGSNTFKNLSFSSGHIYEIEGGQRQIIKEDFNIRGTNCESIWLQSFNDQQAEIFKGSGEVNGEFIEMSNIKALGGATFDAGYFSNDLSASNEGWIFHDNPSRFKVDSIATDIGDTLVVCASNFNTGPGTTYLWQKYPEGDTVGTAYCLVLPPYQTGYYTLTVFYSEGNADCVKKDTFLWGCFYATGINVKEPSCYNTTDGSLDIEIYEGTGTEPYEVRWYKNDDLIANTTRLDSIGSGTYQYSITDAEGCADYGETAIVAPDSLSLDFNVDYTQNMIELDVEGGMPPYNYLWETGAADYYTDIDQVGEYVVVVTDGNNCMKTASVFVDNRFNILSPNAFTPNGDGLNDYFDLFWQGPEILNCHLDIYSRWGNLIFTTDNFDERWNGKLHNNGDLLPRGVYSWRLVVVSFDGKQIESYGTVSLLR